VEHDVHSIHRAYHGCRVRHVADGLIDRQPGEPPPVARRPNQDAHVVPARAQHVRDV